MKTSKKDEICPVCGGEGFQQKKSPQFETHAGISDIVEHYHHLCQSCGGDYATASDIKATRRNIIRFRKGVEKIPLGCEIRAMRLRANLTIEKAGSIFGGGPIAFSKYENDDLIPDEAMVGLLKIAIDDPEFAKRLEYVRHKHVSISIYSDIHEPYDNSPAEGLWTDPGAATGTSRKTSITSVTSKWVTQ